MRRYEAPPTFRRTRSRPTAARWPPTAPGSHAASSTIWLTGAAAASPPAGRRTGACAVVSSLTTARNSRASSPTQRREWEEVRAGRFRGDGGTAGTPAGATTAAALHCSNRRPGLRAAIAKTQGETKRVHDGLDIRRQVLSPAAGAWLTNCLERNGVVAPVPSRCRPRSALRTGVRACSRIVRLRDSHGVESTG